MLKRDEDGYELFRRAIVYRDEEAWAEIYARYRPLLISWAYRCGAGQGATELAEDLADQALARAWIALTPARFATFPSLPQLLGYLRACVATTAIDISRANAAAERMLQALDTEAPATPEQIVLASLDRDLLWRAVIALAATQAERVVLVESLVYGFAPRIIWTRHADLFADIAAVYSTKRTVYNRFQRSPDVLQLCEQFSSV